MKCYVCVDYMWIYVDLCGYGLEDSIYLVGVMGDMSCELRIDCCFWMNFCNYYENFLGVVYVIFC